MVEIPSILASLVLGILVVVLIIAANGYFVAQEFGYMAVDRSRLKARAAAGDVSSSRALRVTARTSFMLSGAQLGITVTGLLAGYVAEPMIGSGIADLLSLATDRVPATVGLTLGTLVALILATVLQMVFGELFPKNLAIARPEPIARRLALSTGIYLRVFGPVIWLFDQAAILLLRAVRIQPVEDVQHAATPRDLERIVAESRQSGTLPAELSTLLDRTLEFHDRTAAHAMIPRPQVVTVESTDGVSRVVELMASGHSRFPVVGSDVDDVVGVVCLRDVLALTSADTETTSVSELVRPALRVPASLPLPGVLVQLRASGEEFACVVDEYGGLAGVITTEDVAEELVGEIADEHDPTDEVTARATGAGTWLVPGAIHVDEVERLISQDLPPGDYETIGGLVIAELRRLPEPGDRVTVELPVEVPSEGEPRRVLTLTVGEIDRHVPATVHLRLEQQDAAHAGSESGGMV
ncbi:hemolysin family protein [Lipingzhangella sp. LS1_29]|uniref:Hemolysin family protein n=1 Tax=Lipingzhangella rawalii TaxID=2055835 RepID=A0ABU2H1H4_9ACTN|nr:hemolysin family protein [Lipingzhangella rawalii]MDS1269158.1 hemolysin family protein [Lipingzhangella rawalii]